MNNNVGRSLFAPFSCLDPQASILKPQASSLEHNPSFVNMALRAVKDIAEGDEVLVHSGRGYWEAAQTE